MTEDMDKTQRNDEEKGKGKSWVGLIIRFIVAAVVLMVTAFLTPGFARMGFGTALLAALVIAAMDWAIQRLFEIDASPFGRGITGFIVAAVIIYLTQFFVPGMTITLMGAVVAALIIGIIDALIPTNVV